MRIHETPEATKVILWALLMLMISTAMFFGLWALTRHSKSGAVLQTVVPVSARA